MNTCISIIVAMGKNQVIGINNELPWRLKSDMERFEKITTGNTVIMGRKTAESIFSKIRKGILPRRLNIIITRNEDLWFPGSKNVHSWEEALLFAENEKEVFVTGGAEIYSIALPYAQRIYLTDVFCEAKGDAFFPKFDRSQWENLGEPEFHGMDSENDYASTFSILKRKNGAYIRT